jgi:zinc and cadmium transporter
MTPGGREGTRLATFAWILGSNVAIIVVALVGGLALLRRRALLERLLLPLVALAAGSLIGGALFHLLPGGLHAMPAEASVWLLVALGFTTFRGARDTARDR